MHSQVISHRVTRQGTTAIIRQADGKRFSVGPYSHTCGQPLNTKPYSACLGCSVKTGRRLDVSQLIGRN